MGWWWAGWGRVAGAVEGVCCAWVLLSAQPVVDRETGELPGWRGVGQAAADGSGIRAGGMVAERHWAYLWGGSHGALAAGVALADVGHLGRETGQVLQRK